MIDPALDGREQERLPGSWILPGRRRLISGKGSVLERRPGAGTSAKLRTGIVRANSLAKQARCPNPTRWSSAADDGAAEYSASACPRASASRRSSPEPKEEASSVVRRDKTSSSSSSDAKSSSRSLALHAISNLFASSGSSTSRCSSISTAARSDMSSTLSVRADLFGITFGKEQPMGDRLVTSTRKSTHANPKPPSISEYRIPFSTASTSA